MPLGSSEYEALCSGYQRHKILTPRARPKGVPIFMSRSAVSRLFTPIVVVIGLTVLGLTMAPGALAQQDSKAGSPAATEQGSPGKVDQTEDQSGDPSKRPITEKRRKENSKSFKHELSDS